MKIAFVDPASFVLPYDYYYIKELSLQGYQVDFFCSLTAYNWDYAVALADEVGVCVRPYRISQTRTNRLLGIWQYLMMLIALYRERDSYSAIHFQFSIFWPLEFIFFTLFGNRLIFTFHDDVPHGRKVKAWWPFLLVFKMAAKVVFVSESVRDRFVENYQISPQNLRKISVVNHGIMPTCPWARRAPTQEASESDAEPLEVCFVGTVRTYKGVDVLPDLMKRQPELRYSVLGKFDVDQAQLKQVLIQAGAEVVDDYLTKEALEDVFRRRAIFILPYRKETQSGILYNLLNYEAVFITSDSGDSGRVLKSYGLGELVFDRNRIETIEVALGKAAIRFEEIKAQIHEIRSHYTWSKTLQNVSLLYL